MSEKFTELQPRTLERERVDNRLAFLQGFLRHPQEVGSIIPSSRFLERRILRVAELERAGVVVELGPGTGGTTQAFLKAMSRDSKLLAVEINADFARLVSEVSDPRLIVCEGDARDLKSLLADHGLGAPDVVLSGIPFSTMPEQVGEEIVVAVQDVLAPGGRFVAYQLRDKVNELGSRVFGPARIEVEVLNVPPMRVYRWDKPL